MEALSLQRVLTDSKSKLLLYKAGLYFFSVLRCCESTCQHLYIVCTEATKPGWTDVSVSNQSCCHCVQAGFGSGKRGV